MRTSGRSPAKGLGSVSYPETRLAVWRADRWWRAGSNAGLLDFSSEPRAEEEEWEAPPTRKWDHKNGCRRIRTGYVQYSVGLSPLFSKFEAETSAGSKL